MKKVLLFPSKHLVLSIPFIMLTAFFVGLFVDTSFLKDYVLIFTFFMIYPTMIGFKLKEAVDLSHMKVVVGASIMNFIIIPAIAFIFGKLMLTDSPEAFAGMMMMSLFPTSGMTISWTMLSKGNVAAATKITALSLILGSFLAPIYLFYTIGTLVKVDILATFFTVIQIVIAPMVLGSITYNVLLKKLTQDQFNKQLKPLFPAFSVWAMLFIIFTSVSMKAKVIVARPQELLNTIAILALFYLINFAISTLLARKFYKPADGYALVYGTVMRNLSIALGLAIAAFGPQTALVITLAFILQVQSAAWYGTLSKKYNWLVGSAHKKTIDTSAIEAS